MDTPNCLCRWAIAKSSFSVGRDEYTARLRTRAVDCRLTLRHEAAVQSIAVDLLSQALNQMVQFWKWVYELRHRLGIFLHPGFGWQSCN